MVLKVFLKFPPALVLVHGWLFPAYGLPFRRDFCWVLQFRVASGVDTEFPYRVHIVDRGG